MLVGLGRRRSAGVADLLIAATAELKGFTVLHYRISTSLERTGNQWIGSAGAA